MSARIRLLYVLAIGFVIAAGCIMGINRMNGEIAELEKQEESVKARKMELDREQSDMTMEVNAMDTDSYIREKARQLGYLAEGELYFVVENPEALYGNGEEPRAVLVGGGGE